MTADLERLAARVVMPVLDLRPGRDLAAAWAEAQRLRALGIGGFILFGGALPDLPERLAALKAGPEPAPLIAADLERGVGQQVRGACPLPPAMALGATDDPALARRAGRALGAEARAVGIDWIFAPVLDLADEPRNPIVGTRAFGADPERVAALGAAFVAGVQEAGAIACAKHFPGHGPTTTDSHDAAPRVDVPAERLLARDLAPFRAAIAADVASVMTAHVAYPALSDPDRPPLPATLDPVLLMELLRGELCFPGVVVTDALIMEGVLEGRRSERHATLLALGAGCDLLLYPRDPEGVIGVLARAAAIDADVEARLRDAAGRLDALRARLGAGLVEDATAVEREVAARAVTRVGPAHPALAPGARVSVLVLDDDAGPSAAPAPAAADTAGSGAFLGHELLATLHEAGVEVTLVPAGATPPDGRLIAIVGCRVRAWKGRAGLAPELAAQLRVLPGERATVVALCGPAPLAGALPRGAELLLTYGDAPAAQAAAAQVLLGAPAPGRLPAPLPGGPA